MAGDNRDPTAGAVRKAVALPLGLIWALGAVAALGSVLSTLSNALPLYTPARALVVTILVCVAWLFLGLLAKYRGLSYETDGKTKTKHSLGARGHVPVLIVIAFVWLPAWLKNRSSPTPPLELGATYYSNFAAVLFRADPTTAEAPPIKSTLVLRNISQSALVNLTVRQYKVTLVGASLRSFHPYYPPNNTPGYFSGTDRNVLQATAQPHSLLLPNETFSIDIQSQLNDAERAMLLSYSGGDTSHFEERALASIDLGLGSTLTESRAFGITFPHAAEPFRTEYFGVVLWIVVRYQVQERLNTVIFVGGQFRGIVVNAGPGVRPMGGANDFMLRLPFAFVAPKTPTESPDFQEVYAPLRTDQELESPSTIGGFLLPPEDGKREWSAPCWFRGNNEQDPYRKCPPVKDALLGYPDTLTWHKGPGKDPQITIRFGSKHGFDMTNGGQKDELSFKVASDSDASVTKGTVTVRDSAGGTATAFFEVPPCAPRYLKLSRQFLSDYHVDYVHLAQIEYTVLGMRDGSEGYLDVWGFNPSGRGSKDAGAPSSSSPR